MKIKFLLIVILTSTIISFVAHAQQTGIIVNLNGDTVKCEMKFPFIGADKYKTAEMEDFKKFNVKDVSYYRTDDLKRVYRATHLPKSKKLVFLQLVEDGKITLYTYTVTSYGYMGATYTNTTWYVSKDNGELQELKTKALFGNSSKKSRQNIFSEMIADNPEVLKQYEEADNFSFKTLQNTVHYYNTGKLIEENKPTDL
ncbi:hypothetical protein ACFQ3S_12335 [Mucilaginibacter terrae]|uniref:hypothetical protein n=1 Tax=Mucilaginibacter terrae TaxID=1955052 RepID=UPI00363687D4